MNGSNGGDASVAASRVVERRAFFPGGSREGVFHRLAILPASGPKRLNETSGETIAGLSSTRDAATEASPPLKTLRLNKCLAGTFA